MRVAVCSYDRDERYALSRMLEDALLRRGLMAEVSLYPMPQELWEAVARQGDAPFALALIVMARSVAEIGALCGRLPVVLIGDKHDGPAAFELGAAYFIQTPVTREALDRALSRCLGKEREKAV